MHGICKGYGAILEAESGRKWKKKTDVMLFFDRKSLKVDIKGRATRPNFVGALEHDLSGSNAFPNRTSFNVSFLIISSENRVKLQRSAQRNRPPNPPPRILIHRIKFKIRISSFVCRVTKNIRN